MYEDKQVRLGPLRGDAEPATYDLCGPHAERTSPPYGWTLVDDRPPDEPPEGLANFDDEQRTAQVLKAALHAVPDGPVEPPSQPAPADAELVLEAAEELAGAERELVAAELAALSDPEPPVARPADRDPDIEPELVPRPVLAVRRGDPVPADETSPPAARSW